MDGRHARNLVRVLVAFDRYLRTWDTLLVRWCRTSHLVSPSLDLAPHTRSVFHTENCRGAAVYSKARGILIHFTLPQCPDSIKTKESAEGATNRGEKRSGQARGPRQNSVSRETHIPRRVPVTASVSAGATRAAVASEGGGVCGQCSRQTPSGDGLENGDRAR